jgi:hypothetical protein
MVTKRDVNIGGSTRVDTCEVGFNDPSPTRVINLMKAAFTTKLPIYSKARHRKLMIQKC